MGSRRHLHLHTNNKISASFFVMCDRVDFYEYQCFFMALPNFHFSKSSYFLPFSAPPPQPLVLFSPFLTFLLISVGIIGTFFHLPSPRHFPHRKTFTLPCYFSISNSFRLYHNHHFFLFIPLQTNNILNMVCNRAKTALILLALLSERVLCASLFSDFNSINRSLLFFTFFVALPNNLYNGIHFGTGCLRCNIVHSFILWRLALFLYLPRRSRKNLLQHIQQL